jgi:hypothetical protein
MTGRAAPMTEDPDRPAFHLRVETAAAPAAARAGQDFASTPGDAPPARFYLGERAVRVVEVIDRWLGTDDRYFKVKGDDGDLYILRHDRLDAHWELTLFTSAAPTGGDD